MKNNRFCGNVYEEKAVEILKQEGYHILERNYRTSYGEVDIIAEKGNILVFVEVKYRKTTKFGFGKEAVDRKKLLRIFRVAEQYIVVQGKENLKIRVDCISFLKEEYSWEKDVAWGDEIGFEMF